MTKKEPDRLPNIHPGEVLQEEFLKPLGISAYRLAQDVRVPQTRISEIIHGKRRITADTAIRFSKYFGTWAEFWIGLQTDFDLEESRQEINSDIDLIPTFQPS
jgi:addiction module HigA family antidote